MEFTPEHRRAVLKAQLVITVAILETARDMGSEGAPSGILYAAITTRFPTFPLDAYINMIEGLKETRYLRQSGNILYWIGKDDALTTLNRILDRI